MGVILTGHVDVPPERRAAVLAALPEHIRLTRAEPGCLRFDVIESPDTPGRLLVDEAFATPADFRAHQTRSAGSPWAEVTAGLPRTYDVTGLEP